MWHPLFHALYPQGNSNPRRLREREVSWASRRWGHVVCTFVNITTNIIAVNPNFIFFLNPLNAVSSLDLVPGIKKT